MKKGMNNEAMVRYNRELLLFHLYRLKGAGIAALAHAMELSVPAVSRLVRSLMDEGKVRLAKGTGSGKGQSAGTVYITPPWDAVICLDIQPHEIRSLLTTVYGEEKTPLRTVPLSLTTKEALIDSLSQELHFYQTEYADLSRGPLVAALAFHGQVDPQNGISLVMPQAPWHEPLHVKFLLEKSARLEVLIDNDCVMRGLAQKWALLRESADCPDFCVINVDYGVGSSFLINQEIYRGPLFGSGQIGHTIIDPHGRLCSCGRIGCLETVASKAAILHQVNGYIRAVTGSTTALTFEEIASRYRAHDGLVTTQINEVAISLGRAIYNFMNLININHIYLYGCACQFGEEFIELIRRQLTTNPFDQQVQVEALATSIEYGKLSESAQVAGIAYLYGEKLYKEGTSDAAHIFN